MRRKLTDDAFALYVAMGTERSYQAVANHFGVSKRAVVNAAKRDGWQDRLVSIEEAAKADNDRRLGMAIKDMNLKHLGLLRTIEMKALKTLQGMELESAIDAVRAIDIAIKHERLILGEPTERQAVSVENLIKRETTEWMDVYAADGDGDAEEDDEVRSLTAPEDAESGEAETAP